MMTAQEYTVTEKQTANSWREGEKIKAVSLSEAKRKASRMQVFQGTVLEISDAAGPIAIKENGVWRNA